MNSIDRRIGANLQRRRNALDMTLDDIAALARMNRDRLSQIESGASRASAEELIDLSKTLLMAMQDIYADVVSNN